VDIGTIAQLRVAAILLAVVPIGIWLAVGRWGYPAWLTPRRRRLVLAGALVAGWVFLAWTVWGSVSGPFGVGRDAFAYWSVDLDDPYATEYLATGAFAYSPAIALVFAPFGAVSWPAFLAIWYGLNLLVLVAVAGRALPLWLAYPPLAMLIIMGNIEILLGFAVVLGFRWPWAWAVIALTKVTPAIGLLWFAVRREWRSLGIALGATALVVGVTWLLAPTQWTDWFALLWSGGETGAWLPLWLRLPAAAALVVWGALRDRKWTVVVAVMFTVPQFWFASLGGLVALAALDDRARRPVRTGGAEADHRPHGTLGPAIS
jgi:hypothetical protein